MELKNYHEIVGTLENYESTGNDVRLMFSIKKTIDVPKNAISFEDLEECKQKKVSILHLDEKYYLKK